MNARDRGAEARRQHDEALARLPAGRFRLEIATFLEGNPPNTPFLTVEERGKQGYTVDRLIKRLGGQQGTLADPFGQPHQIDLGPYVEQANPRIRLIPRFVFEPEDPSAYRPEPREDEAPRPEQPSRTDEVFPSFPA